MAGVSAAAAMVTVLGCANEVPMRWPFAVMITKRILNHYYTGLQMSRPRPQVVAEIEKSGHPKRPRRW